MRLDKFREKLAAENIDGFMVTQPENRRYLSGFTGSNGVLIITRKSKRWQPTRVIMSRYVSNAPTGN